MFSNAFLKWAVLLSKAALSSTLRLAAASRVSWCYSRSCECHHPGQLSPLRASPGCLSRVGKGVARELSSLLFPRAVLFAMSSLPVQWAVYQWINTPLSPAPAPGNYWQCQTLLSVLPWHGTAPFHYGLTQEDSRSVRPWAGVRCVRFLINALLQCNFSERCWAHSAIAILRKQPCLNYLSHLAI